MLGKNRLAVVCAVAFLAGGAAAVVFTRPAAVQAVAAGNADAGRVVSFEAGEPAGGDSDGGRAEDRAVSEVSEPAPARVASGAESSTTGAEGVGAANSSRRTRSRAAVGRVDEDSRADRGYARVPAGRRSSGVNPVVGYPVGGVKKTGQGMKKAGTVVGRTFGKVGGLFHD